LLSDRAWQAHGRRKEVALHQISVAVKCSFTVPNKSGAASCFVTKAPVHHAEQTSFQHVCDKAVHLSGQHTHTCRCYADGAVPASSLGRGGTASEPASTAGGDARAQVVDPAPEREQQLLAQRQAAVQARNQVTTLSFLFTCLRAPCVNLHVLAA
jgi:hypothetical protein